MEKVDVYNIRRENMNNFKERGKLEEGEYSISVHVWILDGKNIRIQKRSANKKIFPNLWKQSGGGVISGETSLDAVKREIQEELGISLENNEITYIGSYTRVKDIVDVWMVQKTMPYDKIKMQQEEIDSIKSVTFKEFEKMIKNGEVVPTINPSYFLLKNYCKVYMRGKLF